MRATADRETGDDGDALVECAPRDHGDRLSEEIAMTDAIAIRHRGPGWRNRRIDQCFVCAGDNPGFWNVTMLQERLARSATGWELILHPITAELVRFLTDTRDPDKTYLRELTAAKIAERCAIGVRLANREVNMIDGTHYVLAAHAAGQTQFRLAIPPAWVIDRCRLWIEIDRGDGWEPGSPADVIAATRGFHTQPDEATGWKPRRATPAAPTQSSPMSKWR